MCPRGVLCFRAVGISRTVSAQIDQSDLLPPFRRHEACPGSHITPGRFPLLAVHACADATEGQIDHSFASVADLTQIALICILAELVRNTVHSRADIRVEL